MKFLASYIVRGQIQALSIALFFGLISLQILPAAILGAAVVALYVLRKGYKKAVLVFIATIALVYLGSLFMKARPGLGFPIIIALLVPVWVSALVLRATESQGSAITTAIGCTALFAISLQLFTGDAVQWWSGWLKTAVSGVKNANYQQFIDSGNINLINGLIATVWGICSIISLFMGRWLQAKLYNPGGFAVEFNQLKIPKPVLFIIATILLVSAASSGNLLNDLLMIFSVIYFFQGLAILHFYIHEKGLSQALLLSVYLIIFFLPHYSLIGLAGAGVMDNFVNFRKLPK